MLHWNLSKRTWLFLSTQKRRYENTINNCAAKRGDRVVCPICDGLDKQLMIIQNEIEYRRTGAHA
jgi:hypothetical protein